MSKSVEYLEHAENCSTLAEEANGTPAERRYKRIGAAWRALAYEQQWLDGEVTPHAFIAPTPSGNTRALGGRPR